MTTAITLEQLAETLHEARMQECHGDQFPSYRQVWTKPTPETGNQPWHDVAFAQAKVVMKLLDMQPKENPLKPEVARLQADVREKGQFIGRLKRELKLAVGGLRSIAYGDAETWPNCSSREVAKQALKDCGGEKS